MNIIITINHYWTKNSFIKCCNSLISETSEKLNLIFVVEKDAEKKVLKILNKSIKQVCSLDEAKKFLKEGKTVIIKFPILFFSNWNIRMDKAINKLGKNYNYVPTFINHRGKQLSILNTMFPKDTLFDLDYKREPIKKRDINYFNTICNLQYKKIKNPDKWIIIYTDKKMLKEETICVLSCALAKLKR